jgi:hypothetical protein
LSIDGNGGIIDFGGAAAGFGCNSEPPKLAPGFNFLTFLTTPFLEPSLGPSVSPGSSVGIKNTPFVTL